MADGLSLGFDTSAAHCAAALVSGTRILAARHEEMTKGQAERLFPLLAELLAEAGVDWRDLSVVGVGTGPGNFTGVRIAVAAARGLALSLRILGAGLDELRDEDAAADERQDGQRETGRAHMSHETWKGVAGRWEDRRSDLLDRAEEVGAEAAAAEAEADQIGKAVIAEAEAGQIGGVVIEDDDLEPVQTPSATILRMMKASSVLPPVGWDDPSPAQVTDQDHKGGRGQDHLPCKLDVVRGDVHVDASAVVPDASIGPPQRASHAHQFSPGIGEKTCRQGRSPRSVQPAYAGREEPPAGPPFFRP